MINLLLGFFIGLIVGVLFVTIAVGDHINFYAQYKAVGKDIDTFKKVIELQNESAK